MLYNIFVDLPFCHSRIFLTPILQIFAKHLCLHLGDSSVDPDQGAVQREPVDLEEDGRGAEDQKRGRGQRGRCR